MWRQMVRHPPCVVGGAPASGQIEFVAGNRLSDGHRPIGGGVGIATSQRAASERGLLVVEHLLPVRRLLVVGMRKGVSPIGAVALAGEHNPRASTGLPRSVTEMHRG